MFGWPKAALDNWIEMINGSDNDTICWANDETVICEKGRAILEEVPSKVLIESRQDSH